MNYVLLIAAVLLLTFTLKKIAMIHYAPEQSVLKEAGQTVFSLLLGTGVIAAIILIPYQVWVLAGRSPSWDGVYVTGGAALLTIAGSFMFYYKSAAPIK